MEVKVGDMVRIDNDPEWYEVSRVTSHSFCVGDGPLFPFYYIYERITNVEPEPDTILLTENEAQCEWLKHWPIELDREYLNSIRLHVCRAQLRKVYEWLDYRCSEAYDEINRLRVVVKISPNDWLQLRKEAGL